ncbi:hypothetical protein HFO27_36125 [Rhizobium leguminosarum]|uniref:hypothetical protein n=1 Tax=Rhizobium leguminosarum TaxID=384 RepID=UPI001C91ECEA|nr:hypothetical protein [Rhizobium leguminosarum]MBY3179884.1 hypothetical protein [Rhizobium leguminosarum]
MIEAVPERLDGSPRQLRRFWSDEFSSIAGAENSWEVMSLGKPQRQWIRRASYPTHDPIGEIMIGNIVVRVGRHVDEAHLQRVIRAVSSA